MADDVLLGLAELARLADECVRAADRIKKAVQFDYGALPPSALGDLAAGSRLYDVTLEALHAMDAILRELARAHDIEATRLFTAISEHQKTDTDGAWRFRGIADYFGL